MKHRNLLLAAVAVLAVMISAQVSRAAQIVLQMQLLTSDSDGSPSGSTVIAPTAGAYNLPNGTQFLVGVFAQVTSPNMTDTARTGTTMDNKPLGISILNTNIVGSGSGGAGAAPNPNGATTSQIDPNFVLSSMLVNAPASPVGRTDLNSDGVTDTAGLGFANLNLTLSTAGSLPGFDVGAGGSSQPVWNLGGTYELIGTAIYTVTDASKQTTLHLGVLSAGLYADPDPSDTSHGNNDLVNQDAVALSQVTGAADLIINPVPEPATMGMLAVVVAGGLISRRRKV